MIGTLPRTASTSSRRLRLPSEREATDRKSQYRIKSKEQRQRMETTLKDDFTNEHFSYPIPAVNL